MVFQTVTTLLAVVGLVVVVGVGLYATDYGVEATVVDKRCSPSGSVVTVETKVGGIRQDVDDISFTQCNIVQNDNFVQYRIQSGRTSIWENEGGRCIWDTEHGLGGCDQ